MPFAGSVVFLLLCHVLDCICVVACLYELGFAGLWMIYRVGTMLGYGWGCFGLVHPLIPCQALGQAFDSSPIKRPLQNSVEQR